MKPMKNGSIYWRPFAVCMLGLAASVAALPSHAVPAWARQTGKACVACHFQHYSALNDFGMDFKAGGFVDIKNKPLSGKDLSIADTLYGSLFSKIRYQKTSGTDGIDPISGLPRKSTHSGELQFPDEFALLLGGRVGANVGFMVEAQLADAQAPTLAGYKLPMIWPLGESEFKGGVVPFTTDALGASYGFELLSTGAVRNVRVSEHRAETSAQQYVMFQGDAGVATGLSFVLHHPRFFAVVAPYTPNHLPGGGSNIGSMNATYFRAAVTPSFAGWSLGGGVQAWFGNNVRADDGTGIALFSTKGWAIDAQAQGNIGRFPLGVYVAHAEAPGSTLTSANWFNDRPNKRKATTVTAELGVIPGKATLLVGARFADNGAATSSRDNAMTIGATYQIYQNVQLQFVHSQRSTGAGNVGRYGPNDPANGTSGGKSLSTLMLSVGY